MSTDKVQPFEKPPPPENTHKDVKKITNDRILRLTRKLTLIRTRCKTGQ